MFNQNSRTNNVVKSSFMGMAYELINVALGFVYRTVFIRVLSSNYLGIDGLFTNVLQILSFADLGISAAITYRFYEPINKNDAHKVGQLMVYFKNVYRIIAIVIFAVGVSLLPFLDFFIKDAAELPHDINLKVIYLLFLLKTLASYLFVYKQTILIADQKQYLVSLFQISRTILCYTAQMIILALSKNYTLILIVNTVLTLVTNCVFSEWAASKYKEVFDVKDSISKEEKRQIINDTKATLCHKIGGTVLDSTDSLIISKYVGIIATGLYSNYSMVLSKLSAILGQLFGSFTSSLGSAHVAQDEEKKYISYRTLLFGNFWFSSICTICLYNLLSDFITIWVGPDMLLDDFTVVILCIQFFIENVRTISKSYTNASGLFIKDKIRPLIEATINLIVSIIMVNKYGIAGVFIGTIISQFCTVFWREPYLLYKYEFKRSMKEYWLYYFSSSLITLVFCFFTKKIFVNFEVTSFILWIFKAIIIFALNNIFIAIIAHKCDDYVFFKSLVLKKIGASKYNRL